MATKSKTKRVEDEARSRDLLVALSGTSQVDPDIEFRSSHEMEFAHLWAELYPDLDLFYEWPVGEKNPKNGAVKTIDFYHKHAKVGIEINGGIYSKNMGHSTASGIKKDYAKQALCNELGINLFTVSTDDMHKSQFLEMIARAIYKALRGEGNGIQKAG